MSFAGGSGAKLWGRQVEGFKKEEFRGAGNDVRKDLSQKRKDQTDRRPNIDLREPRRAAGDENHQDRNFMRTGSEKRKWVEEFGWKGEVEE